MRLQTRNFFCELEPQWHAGPPKWWRQRLRLAWAHFEPSTAAIPWRFAIAVDFQVLPNFRWHHTVIRQQPDRIEVQNTIRGIENWPFSIHFYRA